MLTALNTQKDRETILLLMLTLPKHFFKLALSVSIFISCNSMHLLKISTYFLFYFFNPRLGRIKNTGLRHELPLILVSIVRRGAKEWLSYSIEYSTPLNKFKKKSTHICVPTCMGLPKRPSATSIGNFNFSYQCQAKRL